MQVWFSGFFGVKRQNDLKQFLLGTHFTHHSTGWMKNLIFLNIKAVTNQNIKYKELNEYCVGKG